MTSDTGRQRAGAAADNQPPLMRLARFLARAGFDSRRHAEAAIAEGRVSVNGEVVRVQGSKVAAADVVTVDGRRVELPVERVTILLHKPKDVITAMTDPFGRPTVADLAPEDVPGLFHVGRLDGASTGLLLLTNDGDLGQALVHPRTHVPKRYVVGLAHRPDEAALTLLREGVELDGKRTLPAEVELLSAAAALDRFGASAATAQRPGIRAFADVTLWEGRSRQIRQMFAVTDNEVRALHRYQLGPLALGELAVGAWRRLGDEEVTALAQAVVNDESLPS